MHNILCVYYLFLSVFSKIAFYPHTTAAEGVVGKVFFMRILYKKIYRSTSFDRPNVKNRNNIIFTPLANT